jgi:cell division protein FtsN
VFKKKILLIVLGSALTLAGASMIIYSYLSPVNYFILDDVVAKTEQPTEKSKKSTTKNIEKEEIIKENPVVLKEENKPAVKQTVTQPTKEVATGKYYIISGSFSTEENANMHTKNLQTMGYKNAKMLGKVKSLYKVSIDEFDTREEADIKLREIKEKEQPTAWILYL